MIIKNMSEMIKKNEEAFQSIKEQWIDSYYKAMKEKHRSEQVGDLNGRDLYHGDWKD